MFTKTPLFNLSPEEVNNCLLEKWGISLFKFAQVFAVSPADQFLLRTDYPFSSKEIKTIKHHLKAMQGDLIYRGRLIQRITSKFLESPTKSMTDEDLIKHMRLEGFFKEYIRKHEEVIRWAAKVSLHNKKGSRINKKTIIALGWGNLIAGKSRRMDWAMLGELYYWLWEKVSGYGFYREWKPSYGIEEYLRHQYVRYRWTRGDLFDGLGLRKIEIPGFMSKLFSHQFGGDQADLLKKKLSLAPSEFPKFFMNLIVDSFLARREGLTLFSRDQSLADVKYLFLNPRLLNGVVGKVLFRLLKKHGMLLPGAEFLKDGKEISYKFTEIGKYLKYAADLYLENGISLRHPKPLIIFPDKSVFPTSF